MYIPNKDYYENVGHGDFPEGDWTQEEQLHVEWPWQTALRQGYLN